MMRATLTVLALALLATACGSSSGKPSKYPARERGCPIEVFPETPAYDTENIGPVQASCEESVSDAECLRELQDQACTLGADTVWGTGDGPSMQGGRKRVSGRAAHRK